MPSPFTRKHLLSGTSTLSINKAVGEAEKFVAEVKAAEAKVVQAQRDIKFGIRAGRETM